MTIRTMSLLVGGALILGACAYVGVRPSPDPTASPSPMMPGEPTFETLMLSISNATTLDISLVVNGNSVGVYSAGSYVHPIDPAWLPSSPWHVEAQTVNGRVLVTFDVQAGDVWSSGPDANGHSARTGKAGRADLSCGRLDVWSGPPLLGPAPPSSFPPGDCDP